MYKYSEYLLIKEGSIGGPTILYWEHQLKEILNKNWEDISVNFTDKRNHPKKYLIKFKIGDGTYDYYAAIVENVGTQENFLMQDTQNVIDIFTKKFKQEFWKKPDEYVKNMIYKPKCLGDLSHIELSNTFNL